VVGINAIRVGLGITGSSSNWEMVLFLSEQRIIWLEKLGGNATKSTLFWMMKFKIIGLIVEEIMRLIFNC